MLVLAGVRLFKYKEFKNPYKCFSKPLIPVSVLNILISNKIRHLIQKIHFIDHIVIYYSKKQMMKLINEISNAI